MVSYKINPNDPFIYRLFDASVQKMSGRGFTDNQVRYLRQAYLDGATLGKLAKMAHVRHNTISKIIHRRTYQDIED